jgi:branched-chain amino acid transport system ATP-binding protein
MTPLLELSGVHAGYGIIDVLQGVNLRVMPGEVFALLGPNGAGKSTTLRVASGQIVPSSGTFSVNGREVNGVGSDALARAGICLIPEGRGVFPNLTVNDNLRMWTFSGTPYKAVAEKAFHYFPKLHERRNQLAGTLSGGEQQMLALSRALSTDPVLLMLDDLSMGLAPLIVEHLYERVAELARDGLSILVVEQFAQAVLGVATRAGIMLHGGIDRIGSPAELAAEAASAYLGGHVSSPTENHGG